MTFSRKGSSSQGVWKDNQRKTTAETSASKGAPKLPPHCSHTDKGVQLHLQGNCCCNPPCLSQELLWAPKDIFDLSGAGAASNPTTPYPSLLLTQQLPLISHSSLCRAISTLKSYFIPLASPHYIIFRARIPRTSKDYVHL